MSRNSFITCYANVVTDLPNILNLHIGPALERIAMHILLTTEKFSNDGYGNSIEQHIEEHNEFNEDVMVFALPSVLAQIEIETINEYEDINSQLAFFVAYELSSIVKALNCGWNGCGIPVDSSVLHYYKNEY